MKWDYSGRKGRDGQKKKIGKANERKGKVKRGKDEEVNEQGTRGAPAPHKWWWCVQPPSGQKQANMIFDAAKHAIGCQSAAQRRTGYGGKHW